MEEKRIQTGDCFEVSGGGGKKIEIVKHLLVFRFLTFLQISNRWSFSTATCAYLASGLFNDLQSFMTNWEMPLMVSMSPVSEVLRRPQPLWRAIRLALGEHVSC